MMSNCDTQSTDTPSHWDDHEDYPVSDWQYQVANGVTRLGYHAWVASEREMNELDQD